MRDLNPRQFLMLGGIILLALGVLGMFVLGPTAQSSLLGEFFWLDSTENVAHLLFGVVALAAYYFLKDEMMTKWLVVLVGIVALLAAVVGFMGPVVSVPLLGETNLENPSDNVLHLVVAVWAFWAAFMGKGAAETAV